MDREFYTELVYRHKCMEDFGPEVVSARKCQWDCDADIMLEMFHTIFIGATYNEDAFCDCLASYLQEHGYDVCEHIDEESSDE